MTKTCKKMLATYGQAPAKHLHPTIARKIADLKYLDGADARRHMGLILKECQKNKALCSDFVRYSLAVSVEMDAMWA
jgi:hypothetical protein